MEVLQRQLDVLADELNQVKSEMADQDTDRSSSGEYIVRFFGGNV